MIVIASLLVETNGMQKFIIIIIIIIIIIKERISINFLQLDYIGYPISCTYYVYISGLIEGV